MTTAETVEQPPTQAAAPAPPEPEAVPAPAPAEPVCRFEPLNDGVLTRVFTSSEKTKGGIILPDSARKPLHQGKVIAVGPGRTLESGHLVPLTLKPGAHICFGVYSGQELEVDGVKYLLLRAVDILGILHPRRDASGNVIPEEFEAPEKLAKLPDKPLSEEDRLRRLGQEPTPPTSVGPTPEEIEKAVSDLVGEPVKPAEPPPSSETIALAASVPSDAEAAALKEPTKFARNLDAL